MRLTNYEANISTLRDGVEHILLLPLPTKQDAKLLKAKFPHLKVGKKVNSYESLTVKTNQEWYDKAVKILSEYVWDEVNQRYTWKIL